MDYEDLVDLISHRMPFSDIDQPRLILVLLNKGGVATVGEIANAFVAQQYLRCEERIRRVTLPAFEPYPFIQRRGEDLRLDTTALTDQDISKLRALCEQRIESLRQPPENESSLDQPEQRTTIPDSLRYKVLSRACGRCELCGISSDERLLRIDHIIAPTRGGNGAMDNLHALCTTCQKGKDVITDEESRVDTPQYDPGCKFCWQREKWSVYRHGTVWAHRDGHPVSDGHHLVIPVRHTDDFFTMTDRERRDANTLIGALRSKLLAEDASIEGFNVGMNCGAEAGQSIFHAHWHLIPRRKNDSKAKKGGIRGVIPERADY